MLIDKYIDNTNEKYLPIPNTVKTQTRRKKYLPMLRYTLKYKRLIFTCPQAKLVLINLNINSQYIRIDSTITEQYLPIISKTSHCLMIQI